MSRGPPYSIDFTPAARRRLDKLPLPAATALYEHLTGPVAGNPYVGYAGGLQRKRALVELGQALPPRLPSPAVPGYG